MKILKLFFIVFTISMKLKSNLVLSQDQYDDIAPSFGYSCPPELQVFYIDKCQKTYSYNYRKPTATDNSNRKVYLTEKLPDGFQGYPPFNFPVGIYNFLYTASDGQGNKGYCQFAVLILMRPSCPNEIGLPSSTSGLRSSRTCGNRYGSKASYICMRTKKIILKYSCNKKGDWKKIYELNEDGSCQDTVQNDVAPRFDYCPPSQVQYVGECCDKVAYSDIPRSATDSNNEPLNIMPHFSPEVPKPDANSVFILSTGLYNFRYDATDKKGNTATCSFRVVVLKRPGCAKDLTEVPPGSESNYKTKTTCGQQYGSVLKRYHQEGNRSTVIDRYKCLNGEWTKTDKDEVTDDSNSCPPSLQDNDVDLDAGEVIAIALCCAIFGSVSTAGGVVVYRRKKNDSEPEPTFDNPLADRESSFRSDSLPVILSENDDENNINVQVHASVA